MKRAGGFTLIEIVVALAVLAVAMGAVISGMARSADNAAYLREKTIAIWVVHNRLAEVQLDVEARKAMPRLGNSDGDVDLAGIGWRWTQTVEDTPDPNVLRINVSARREDTKDDVAQLSGFLVK